MHTTYVGNTTMVQVVCGGCGVIFAMSEVFCEQRQKDHKTWRCPNGCSRYYSDESDEERLQRQLKMANASNANLREQRDHYERSRNGMKGQLTRVKNRIAKGICPCCNRTFKNLASHMKTQHPDYGGTPDAD